MWATCPVNSEDIRRWVCFVFIWHLQHWSSGSLNKYLYIDEKQMNQIHLDLIFHMNQSIRAISFYLKSNNQ